MIRKDSSLCARRAWPTATARPGRWRPSISGSRPAAWWGSSVRTVSANRACLGLIAGVRKIQGGMLEVLGGDMRSSMHRTAVCPRIAYMPQGLGRNLYLTLSVFENVDFFGRLFGQGRG